MNLQLVSHEDGPRIGGVEAQSSEAEHRSEEAPTPSCPSCASSIGEERALDFRLGALGFRAYGGVFTT